MKTYSREEHATYLAGLLIAEVPNADFEKEVTAVHKLVGQLLPILAASHKVSHRFEAAPAD